MATMAMPFGPYSRANRTKPSSRCLTYGQWLQMKATSNPFEPAKSRSAKRLPAGSARAKSGAGVPSASMRDSLAGMWSPLRLGRRHRISIGPPAERPRAEGEEHERRHGKIDEVGRDPLYPGAVEHDGARRIDH